MKLAVIAAMAENRVIGRGNALPWRLPADLKRFRRLTMGSPLIMGRKTFASIGRPLPGRTSIVLTRDPTAHFDGAVVAGSLDAALAAASALGAETAYVIGGEAVFAAALPRADLLYLTLVEAKVEGDVYFPPLDLDCWMLAEDERHDADADNAAPFSFRVYRRSAEPIPRSG